MRFFFFLFTIAFTLMLSTLNAQGTNTNEIATNEISTNSLQVIERKEDDNVVLSIGKLDAMRNPASFVNLINLSTYKQLKDYAVSNNIVIKDNDKEGDLRARIIEIQTGIVVDRTLTIDQVNEATRKNPALDNTAVYLRKADYVERYPMKEANEDIITLHGGVEIDMYDYNLKADKVVYSLKTSEVYADGNITVEDSQTHLVGKWFLLNRENKHGVLFNGDTTFEFFRIKGKVLKYVDNKFYTENSLVSFSRLTPLAHDFFTSRVYFWDNKKILLFNSIYRVGVQPIFYFPIFMQNYWGSGIITTFGETKREGVFIQNQKSLSYGGANHKIRFDLYQKLGILVGDEIRYSGNNNTISLDAMFAMGRQYYLLDTQTTSILGINTRYLNYFGTGASGKLIPRYRINYDHSLLLFQTQNIRSSLSTKITMASDLYFNSDFNNVRDFDIFSFFRYFLNNDFDDLQDPSYENYTQNALKFNNSFFGLNVDATVGWDLQAVRNLSVDNNTNFDYMKNKSSKLTLPSLSTGYSGVIGKDTSYFIPGLNLNYNINGSYSYTINYKTSEGIYFYDNPNLESDLNEKINEKHNLNLSGGLSRPFSGLFYNFSPSVRGDYYYQSTVDANEIDSVYDKLATYFAMSSGVSFNIFFPVSILSDNFKRYFEPNLNLNTSYNIGYKFRDKYDSTEPYGGFTDNRVNANLTLGGTGYSLFFIPNLNLNVSGSIGSGYDLKPRYDFTNKKYVFVAETNRIQTTEASASTRLSYDRSYISAGIGKNLLGTNFTTMDASSYFYVPLPFDLLINTIVRKSSGDIFFDGIDNSFQTYFSFSYSHDFINYKYNRMAFSLGLDLKIYELWRFSFSTSSANNRAYRYIKEYANRENEEWINIFEDIKNSFAFGNYDKQSASLFKLGSISASVWHDVDGWDLQIYFAISPTSLPYELSTGSIKGSYWDKEFWITFTSRDFGGLGFPQKNIDLNGKITDLISTNRI